MPCCPAGAVTRRTTRAHPTACPTALTQVARLAHDKYGGAEGLAQHQQAHLDAQLRSKLRVRPETWLLPGCWHQRVGLGSGRTWSGMPATAAAAAAMRVGLPSPGAPTHPPAGTARHAEA